MFERFTDSARDVVVGAQHEARRLGHDAIGTEHLLLALLLDENTVAARAPASLAGSVDAVRQQVEATTGRGPGSPDTHIPFTPRGKKTLELALRAALQLHDAHIGAEHILLGLVPEGPGTSTGTAIRALAQLGVQPADIRGRVLELLGHAADASPEEDRVEVSISRESSVSMGMQAASGDEPRCPRCNADAVANLRAREVPVADESTTTRVTLVWCDVCGAVIGVLPSDSS